MSESLIDVIGRLRAVPNKVFLRIPTGIPLISAEIPLGELCHETATQLEASKKWADKMEQERDYWHSMAESMLHEKTSEITAHKIVYEKLCAEKFRLRDMDITLDIADIMRIVDPYLATREPVSKHHMPDGRPIFGEDSPHDIGEHLEKVAEQPVGLSAQIATGIIEGIWSRWYGKYRGDVDTDIMAAILADAKHKIITALRKCDEEMERVKACEHIAEGDMEGNDWRVLRNICPSTMAVAALRDKYETLLKRESVCRHPADIDYVDGWPNNICADRHEVSKKWVLQYLTDEQAEKCKIALQQIEGGN